MIFFDGTYRLKRGGRTTQSNSHARGSAWRLRIINLSISLPEVTHLKPIIVVATPADDGIFFSTCAESLGRKICRDFDLNPSETLWVENYPYHESRVHVAIFKIRSYLGMDAIYSIDWRPIRPNELDAIRQFIVEI